jgi:predicted acetyltransferase
VKAADRGVAEPVRWRLADARVLRQVERGEFQWVRLLDPAAALAARRYPAPGRVVLEVADAMGHAGGCYELDGGPDGAECRRTTRSPDLTLDVRDLGTAYLGGFTVCDLAAGGRVVEHTAGALGRADAMFRSGTAPWSATWF